MRKVLRKAAVQQLVFRIMLYGKSEQKFTKINKNNMQISQNAIDNDWKIRYIISKFYMFFTWHSDSSTESRREAWKT